MDLSYDSERPRTKGNQKGTQNFSWTKLEIWKKELSKISQSVLFWSIYFVQFHSNFVGNKLYISASSGSLFIQTKGVFTTALDFLSMRSHQLGLGKLQ